MLDAPCSDLQARLRALRAVRDDPRTPPTERMRCAKAIMALRRVAASAASPAMLGGITAPRQGVRDEGP